MNAFSPRRLAALCKKESLQVVRDPSSILIAFILPVVMLFIYGYGVNLDTSGLKLGIVLEDTGPEARELVDSFIGSKYFITKVGYDRAAMQDELIREELRGLLIIPPDFAKKLNEPGETAPIQIVTDGSMPNTAKFVENLSMAAWRSWLAKRMERQGRELPQQITLEERYWYNPSAISRNYLVPGSITLIMTVVGALLTSLVVAREWERGTMEALLTTPVLKAELLISKVLPYYVLGMGALAGCWLVAVLIMKVPFRGSLLMMVVVSSFYLGSALGMGLLFSTITRNQFNAAQATLNAAFMPGIMLSGFIYEIASMPKPLQLITYLIPARYYVNAMQTLFQAGDIHYLLWTNIAYLTAAALFFLGLTARNTRRTLE
jgi:ABC-2 type transport system permease protein